MLANSNLSIIPSKPTSNVSSTGDGSVDSIGDSFDAAFQQANDSLSSGSSSVAVVNSEKTKPIPQNDSVDTFSNAPITSDANNQAVVLGEGEDITAKVLEGNVLALSASTDVLASQENANALTPTGSTALLPIVGAGVLAAGAINDSDGISELTDQPRLGGVNEGDVIKKNGANKEIALNAAPTLSGNSLQSKGGNVASLNANGQSNDQAGVIASTSADQADAIDAASVGLAAGVNLDVKAALNQSKVPGQALDSSSTALDVSHLDIATSMTPNGTTTGSDADIKQTNLSELELVGEQNAHLSLDALPLSSAEQSVDQKNTATSGKLDIAAGLAMIGAGNAVSQSNKAMSAKELSVAAKQNASIATELIGNSAVENAAEESADLDWIMQQMSNESKVTNENVLMSDAVKQSLSTNSPAQVIGQNSDSPLKQVVPLSLGVATVESGLVDLDGADAFVEINGGPATNIKLDAESLKQIDAGSSVKVGLGENAATSSTVNPATQSGGEVKLGLAVNANNSQNNMTMQVPPTHPNWSSEMGEKVMWINKQGLQQAEIHLDPPELGSLTVKVTIDSDVASVSFAAASTQVKDLLEGQVQRLREMLAQQGVELAEVDVNVSQQGSGSNASGDSSDNQFARNDQEEDDFDSEFKPQETRVSQSKVDFYA